MKAFLTLGDGIDALWQVERPEPRPGPDEVLVRLRAAALNYRDLLVVNGVGGWKPREARIPLSDGAGIVVATGERVSRVRVGDRVAGIFLPKWLDGELTAEKYVAPLGGAVADGVAAAYRLFHEEAVVPVPDHLDDVEAATLPVAALTAWHAVSRRSRVQPGDQVLIQGTGGVSLFATQFVRALGGSPIVTSSSDEKLERVRALGAAATINYRRCPAWEQEVLRLTGGRGVDHVIEVVGGENLNRSLDAVRLSGTISFIGLIAGLGGTVDTYRFVTRNVTIHGIETGSREMFEEMNRFLLARRLHPIIDRPFPFDELPDALRYLERGGHFGKVVVVF
ncbi:MAG TPA: NAD(P)-dependent alcohol dehydrogenase [Gemmatimonadales bacterium]|nr:NAD(P)-dependent alcohol dehydrogenase [Gemmatimonadales bacterium]